MLTHEQEALLHTLEARHNSHTTCIVCQPNTPEWSAASELLHFDSHSENGDKFSGNPTELRTFFERVNELHRHSDERPPLQSLLCGE